jgi:hypothetical protein
METGRVTIVCKFDPALYIEHRVACVRDIMFDNRDKIPDEVYEEIADNLRKAMYMGSLDYYYEAVSLLEKVLGITIIDVPIGSNP